MDGRQSDPLEWPTGGGAMGALVRAHAWAATPLGPLAAWPPRLRNAVDTALSCAFPMIVLWGPDLVQVYNDGYRAVMGVKHPAGLGQPTRDCWPEVWPINAPIYERVWAGETLTFEDALYPITRSGALEDAWFTLCYSPLHDTDGATAGILVTVFETTARVRADRARAEAQARPRHLGALGDHHPRPPDALCARQTAEDGDGAQPAARGRARERTRPGW